MASLGDLEHPLASSPWTVTLSWFIRANFWVFWGILTRKVAQTDLFLAYDHGSLVGMRTQEYKSLCAAATTCCTVVNIQRDTSTHRQTDSILTSL